jgi:hypothetical protein
MKPPPVNGLDRTSARREASAAHLARSILGIAWSLLTSASETVTPWASDTHPTDRAKSHGEEVVTSPHAYRVVQGGTMDGRNCRSPMGCGIAREGAYLQNWESNRSVRMENMGETDLINPWLLNGRNTFRSVAEIVATAVTPGMTDAEKAFALWFQEIQYRHHSPGDNNELLDPVKVFNVYGSDEKEFTIADQPYQGTVGVTKVEMAAWNPWFPANFIAETASTESVVMGGDVELPAANKTYYRVVAVDEQGKRSGPSDYTTAPRPVIYSKPVKTAKVGLLYSYPLGANRSLGDLSARMKDQEQVTGYFDIEKPRLTLERGPAWLTIDQNTGALSGTPDATGRVEVVVAIRLEREVRHLDEPVLAWGNEKVLSTSVECVGAATQDFTITVE